MAPRFAPEARRSRHVLTLSVHYGLIDDSPTLPVDESTVEPTT